MFVYQCDGSLNKSYFRKKGKFVYVVANPVGRWLMPEFALTYESSDAMRSAKHSVKIPLSYLRGLTK